MKVNYNFKLLSPGLLQLFHARMTFHQIFLHFSNEDAAAPGFNLEISLGCLLDF